MKVDMGQKELQSKRAVVYGQSENIGIHSLAAVVNGLAAAGAACLGISVRIEYPSHADKSNLYKIEKYIKKECKKRQIPFAGSELVCNPLLSVTSVGVTTLGEGEKDEVKCVKEIVLVKWIGMDGMLQIMKERGEELKKRFSPSFLRRIESYEEALFSEKEIKSARKKGAEYIYQVTEGGIFAALWHISQKFDTGLDVNMKEISVLQETVEVCEHFRLNPYQMTSAGCFLVLTKDGETFAEEMRKEGIAASVIGCTTDKRDKILRNGEDIRFLDRPSPDEIFKLHTTNYQIESGERKG